MTTESANSLACPSCGSRRIWKAGFDAKRNQLFLCKNCFRRFQVKLNVGSQVAESLNSMSQFRNSVVSFASEKSLDQLSFEGSEYIGSHKLPIVAKNLNALPSYSRERGAAEMQQQTQTNRTQNRIAEQTFKGQLIQFAFFLKKTGKSDTTIISQCGSLKTLYNTGANLYDPESIKEIVALKDCSNGTKRNLVNAYKNFAKFAKVLLPEMPDYKVKTRLPFIPTESELDQLIACAGPKLQPYLQTLKETFARSGEVAALKWRDLNLKGHVITINDAEKNSNPRQIEISDKLVTMLNRIPRTSELVFGENVSKRMRQLFHWTRTRLSYRTQNPRIKQIHLHSFRHWGATMLYHDTKDILLVMVRLGHKSITSTQIYLKLLQTGNRDEYTSKIATTLEEAQTLIDSGFEYVTDMQMGKMTYKLFRKKKLWRPH
jgi:integrase/transcription elongation factor Elf1